MRRCLPILVIPLAVCPAFASDCPILRLDANTYLPLESATGALGPDLRAERSIQVSFTHTPVAWEGLPGPEGGYFLCRAWLDPATINNSGQIAFFSQVLGLERNQGIFRADANGVMPVAIGCGGLGGWGQPGPCGDPAPGGGTFAGMFSGTYLSPAINDNGDVLFVSDIYEGGSLRGLFLYRSLEGDIIKIARIGDLSPLGGQITGIGEGSINNARQIVFLAETNGGDSDILKYDLGALSVVAALGQPAPQGGTFQLFCTEEIGWGDGTMIPVGPIPDINDAGDIAFCAWVTGGAAEQGVFVSHNGVHSWWLRYGQSTPLGGTYWDFWAPNLNNSGEMALLAMLTLPNGQDTAAWIVGRPPNWHKALTLYDLIDGGLVWGLSVSRNPFNVLDDCGNLAAYCQLKIGSVMTERMLIVDPLGNPNIVARQGDSSPFGGSFDTFQWWPTFNSVSQMALGAGLVNASADAAQFVSAIANLPGDANNDAQVDAADWAELPAVLGSPDTCAQQFAARVFDFDGDHDVDLRDVAGFQAVFGG